MHRVDYFPKTVRDVVSMWDWHEGVLSDLMEPSLMHSPEDSFRVLWYPPFRPPVVARIDHVGGVARGVVRQSDRADLTGFRHFVRTERRSEIATCDWERLRETALSAGYWNMPTKDPRGIGIDGEIWLLEGKLGSAYRLVERWCPRERSFREFGMSILRLVAPDLADDRV